MKNIIVFGATGDTGRYFVDYFMSHAKERLNQYRIIAVGTRKTNYFEKQYGIEYITIDISEKADFEKLPREAYAVVDFAGYMPSRMKGYDPYKHLSINLIGTLNVLEYCRKVGADRILFAQSFGDIKDHAEKKILLSIDLPKNFSYKSDHTIYVIAKNASVELIENYHQMYGIKRFIFRLPTIYMYSDVRTFYVDGMERPLWYRVLIDKAVKGETLEVWGDYTRKKDMVYVKDFCQMLYLALFCDRSEGYYNVGTGVGTSLLEQFEGMQKVFCAEPHVSKLVFCPDKPNTPQYIMDIKEAKNELGYIPQYDYISYLKDYKVEMQARRFAELDT